METSRKRKIPPIWLLILIFFTLYLLISIGITHYLRLPGHIPFPYYWSIAIGSILLLVGFCVLGSALLTLKLRRAFGKDIYKPKSECKLVTTGIYAHVRNPVYLGNTLMLWGWFFVLQLTVVLFLTTLFMIHFYLVAKWEEKELTERFGDDYLQYKKRVPFIIPFLKKR